VNGPQADRLNKAQRFDLIRTRPDDFAGETFHWHIDPGHIPESTDSGRI
jgi:hypothetical protein